jgi:hypothetical protein
MPPKVLIEIKSLKENDERFLEIWPDFSEGSACGIVDIEVEVERKYRI